MSKQYIEYLLSMQLKELAQRDFKHSSWNREDHNKKNKDWKPIYYQIPPVDINNINNYNEDKKENIIQLDKAIKTLLENGANPLVKDMDNKMVLEFIITSGSWDINEKLIVIDTISPQEMKNVPRSDMNKLFIESAKYCQNLQPNQLQDWEFLLDIICEKGFTYYQGKEIISQEILMMTNNGLSFFELLAHRVPSFNFEHPYILNDTTTKTLLEVGEDYLAKPRVGDSSSINTIQFIKSYAMYRRINEHENFTEIKQETRKKIKV